MTLAVQRVAARAASDSTLRRDLATLQADLLNVKGVLPKTVFIVKIFLPVLPAFV
jgi:hypothetical protein